MRIPTGPYNHTYQKYSCSQKIVKNVQLSNRCDLWVKHYNSCCNGAKARSKRKFPQRLYKVDDSVQEEMKGVASNDMLWRGARSRRTRDSRMRLLSSLRRSEKMSNPGK